MLVSIWGKITAFAHIYPVDAYYGREAAKYSGPLLFITLLGF